MDKPLFIRLLKSISNSSSVSGEEEYLTQVLYTLLSEDHELASFVLENMGLEIHDLSELEFYSEKSYEVPDSNEGARVDLVAETKNKEIFIENKIGASLNKYSLGETEDSPTEDQLERYSRILEHKFEDKSKHLFLLGKKPEQTQDELNFYEGQYYWWDIYKFARDFLENNDDVDSKTQWLIREFLDSFDEWYLNPPEALDKGEAFDQKMHVRFLIELARQSDEIDEPHILETSERLKFQKNDGKTYLIRINSTGSLEGHIQKEGRLKSKSLDEDFWQSDFQNQLAIIQDEIASMSEWERAPDAEISEEEWISFFEDPKLVETFIRSLEDETDIKKRRRGDKSSGTAEQTIRFFNGNRIRLAPYSGYDRLLIKSPPQEIESLLDGYEELVGRILEEKLQTQINMNLNKVSEEELPKLVSLIKDYSQENYSV